MQLAEHITEPLNDQGSRSGSQAGIEITDFTTGDSSESSTKPKTDEVKKVVVVEDETLLRELVCSYVDGLPGFELAGAVDNGEEAYQACLQQAPDIIILDLILPQLDGLQLLEKFRATGMNLHILVFSSLYTRSTIKQALQLGVEGFVEKDAELPEFRKALERVAGGELYFSPHILKVMHWLAMHPDYKDDQKVLTKRELEVLSLIAKGYSNPQIAKEIKISSKTVDTHRTNMMRKLNLHDVAAITRYAIQYDLIDEPDFPPRR